MCRGRAVELREIVINKMNPFDALFLDHDPLSFEINTMIPLKSDFSLKLFIHPS